MADQASQLRALVNKHSDPLMENVNIVSVVSGKGGVGKTTLITELYSEIKNAFIIDCDINSPYFWMQGDNYRCCDGFDSFNNKKVIKSVEKSTKLGNFNYVLVDAGTGLNEINRYYLDKSKIKIFVTSMEDISILNTMNLMKNVKGQKILYIPLATDDDILDMQSRINRYSKSHLDNSHILVCSDMGDMISVLDRNRA